MTMHCKYFYGRVQTPPLSRVAAAEFMSPLENDNFMVSPASFLIKRLRGGQEVNGLVIKTWSINLQEIDSYIPGSPFR